jgi:type I restriction enzyme S subunit
VSELPRGWIVTTLQDIAMWSSGGTPSRSKPAYYVGTIPWFKTGELGPRVLKASAEHISDEAVSSSSAKVFPKGSVALAMYGATIGKTSIFGIDAATNQACAVGIPDATSAEFLYYFLVSQEKAFVDAGKGGAQPNISQGIVKEWPLWLPPAAEQTRIVEKLEELLSDLDAGVAELKTAQKKLVQYRQSLLKAAVEGTLTTEWRTTNQPKETGTQLLERILIERRARWEAKQLAKFKEQGKSPPKGWQSKYPEPVKPDTSELPELPEGWVWASLDQLAEFITSGSRGWADFYSNEGSTFIRSQNINKDYLDLSEIAFVTPPRNSEGERTRVGMNDLLLTITGANVGKAARMEIQVDEAYVSQHVALIRPVDLSLSNYLHLFLTASAGGRGQLDKEAYGAGKPGLNLQQVKSVLVPLPPNVEVKVLIEYLANQFNAITEQSMQIALTLKQSAAQRKNILKAAFAGQLVPQDPNDEPAGVLLERIRAEREQQKKQPKIKNPRKSTGMKKSDLDNVRDWIASKPDASTFNFSELSNSLPGDYEALKDSLFQLLAEDKPIIEQGFDRETSSLQLKRVKS